MFSPIQDNSDTNSNQNFAFFDSTASDKLSDCEFLEIPLLHDTPSPNNTKKIDNDAFLSYFMKIDYVKDEFGNQIDVARHPKEIIRINCDKKISKYAIMCVNFLD